MPTLRIEVLQTQVRRGAPGIALSQVHSVIFMTFLCKYLLSVSLSKGVGPGRKSRARARSSSACLRLKMIGIVFLVLVAAFALWVLSVQVRNTISPFWPFLQFLSIYRSLVRTRLRVH